MEKNKTVITTWDDVNFNPNEIGIIFITKDGHTLYGIVNKELQDFKYPIGHTSIFDACIKELGIDLPPGLDQMDYAWSLASSDINIIYLLQMFVMMRINMKVYLINLASVKLVWN